MSIPQNDRRHPRAIVFGSDGMRHDLMVRYAAAGAMPVFAELLARGATGAGGCVPALPSNTGAGWATLQTGAWSGTTGAMNNVYHRTDTPITQATSGFDATLNCAETLAQAAERQGLRTASFEWPGTLPATCAGPVVDFRSFYSARGALLVHDPPGYLPELAVRLGLSDQRVRFAPTEDWLNAPASDLPLREAVLEVPSANTEENPHRTYHLLAYATSPAGYDRLLVARDRDGARPVATMKSGEWAPVRVTLLDGRAAGFSLKLIELAPDLSQCWLYFTSVSRARASDPALEERLNAPPFLVPETADHGPVECGIVDVATYVEQGLLFFPRAEQVARYLIETYRPDVLFAGSPVTDEFSHQFLGLVTPSCPSYTAAAAPRYEAYLREAYAGADRLLGFLLGLHEEVHGGRPLVAVSADHGFSGAWLSINANLVLEHAGLIVPDAIGRPLPQSQAAGYWAGGTCNVYVNLAGRQPGGCVPPERFAEVRDRIVAVFRALNEQEGGAVIADVRTYDETAAVPTSGGPASMQFPGRTGDVVVFASPPHQFDAATPGRLIAPSPLYGQHGYLPDALDARFNCDMRPPFLFAGPGVAPGTTLTAARAIDFAPTIAALLGIEGPCHADGRALR